MKDKQLFVSVLIYVFLLSFSWLFINKLMDKWLGSPPVLDVSYLYIFVMITVSFLIYLKVTSSWMIISRIILLLALLIFISSCNILLYPSKYNLITVVGSFRKNLKNYEHIDFNLVYNNTQDKTKETIALYKYQNWIPKRSFLVYLINSLDSTEIDKEFYVLQIGQNWTVTNDSFNIEKVNKQLIISSKLNSEINRVSFPIDLNSSLVKERFEVHVSSITSLSELLIFQYFYHYLESSKYPVEPPAGVRVSRMP